MSAKPSDKTLIGWMKYMGITGILCLIPGVNVIAIPLFLGGLVYPLAWGEMEAQDALIEMNRRQKREALEAKEKQQV